MYFGTMLWVMVTSLLHHIKKLRNSWVISILIIFTTLLWPVNLVENIKLNVIKCEKKNTQHRSCNNANKCQNTYPSDANRLYAKAKLNLVYFELQKTDKSNQWKCPLLQLMMEKKPSIRVTLTNSCINFFHWKQVIRVEQQRISLIALVPK